MTAFVADSMMKVNPVDMYKPRLENFFATKASELLGKVIDFSIVFQKLVVPQQDGYHDCGFFVIESFKMFFGDLEAITASPEDDFSGRFSQHDVIKRRRALMNHVRLLVEDLPLFDFTKALEKYSPRPQNEVPAVKQVPKNIIEIPAPRNDLEKKSKRTCITKTSRIKQIPPKTAGKERHSETNKSSEAPPKKHWTRASEKLQ